VEKNVDNRGLIGIAIFAASRLSKDKLTTVQPATLDFLSLAIHELCIKALVIPSIRLFLATTK